MLVTVILKHSITPSGAREGCFKARNRWALSIHVSHCKSPLALNTEHLHPSLAFFTLLEVMQFLNSVEGFLVSNLAYKELRSHHSNLLNTSKKLNKQKYRQLFLNSAWKWNHRANFCPPNWRDKQADTEMHTLPEWKPTHRCLHRNRCWSRKPWAVIGGLLEAQRAQVWALITPGGSRDRRLPHFHQFYLRELYQVPRVHQRKIPSCFWQWEWKRNTLEHFVLFNKVFLQEKLLHQSLTYWGFLGD